MVTRGRGDIFIVRDDLSKECILKATKNKKASLLGVGPTIYDYCDQEEYMFIVMKNTILS